ncbi:hypothetical protein EDD21DRAFT_339562 [Dissophora ornata]|nr:hypothetical protein BGZ58_000476 [Dissophora ornata]KAI8599630.1 hypothetical protein EDD21DRAFT_339562 [Dissophora ornata]
MPICNVFTNPRFWRTFFDGIHYSYDDIPDLTGQVAIVTGATGDLGYATVVALAAHGAHVFFACRNRVKAEEAIKHAYADILQLQFDFPNAKHAANYDFEKNRPKLEFLELELSEAAKAKAAATEFLKLGLPLNILVCNGGIKGQDYDLTDDGYENHFGVNHLGHFAFTTTLLERVRESAPARIVILSSMAHELPPSNKAIDFKNLRSPTVQEKNPCVRYGQSKLANVLFGKALARRLKDDRVYVNMVHPGLVDARLEKEIQEATEKNQSRGANPLLLKFAYKVRDAALTPLYLATSPEIVEKDIRGRYFIPIANELRPNPLSDSVDLQDELWAYSEKAVQGDHRV